MKEHGGGAPDVGYIPVDWEEDESFAVPIEHFNYASLDRPSDLVIEAYKQGRDPEVVLKAIVNQIAQVRAAALSSMLISQFRQAKNPRMMADQIVWATGMNLFEGAGCEQMASKYGVSKQAFVQGAHRICEKLKLKPCRNMRDEKARETMRKRNYRHNGK